MSVILFPVIALQQRQLQQKRDAMGWVRGEEVGEKGEDSQYVVSR